jgi:hypothetical protein
MKSDNPEGIACNRIKAVEKNNLIPGLKYIVGHDIINSDMQFPKSHDNKVILVDCARSSGLSSLNNDVTKASYVIADPQSLSEETFITEEEELIIDCQIVNKKITKEASAKTAEEVCNAYLRSLPVEQVTYPAVYTPADAASIIEEITEEDRLKAYEELCALGDDEIIKIDEELYDFERIGENEIIKTDEERIDTLDVATAAAADITVATSSNKIYNFISIEKGMTREENIADRPRKSYGKYQEYESVDKKSKQHQLLGKRRSSIAENIKEGYRDPSIFE